jgi:molecular chaperone DnaJ
MTDVIPGTQLPIPPGFIDFLKSKPGYQPVPEPPFPNYEASCPACRGSGQVPQQVLTTIPCYGCAGTGRDLNEDLYMAWCRTCGGKRVLHKTITEYRSCFSCHGTGKKRM